MDISKLLDTMNPTAGPSGTGSSGGFTSGLLGGVAGGALTSALLSKQGRKHLGSIAKLGGVAALGGLAWKAYSSYNQNNQASSHAQPASQSNDWHDLKPDEFKPDTATTYASERNLLLIRAMIAAAYADGTLDDEERQRIFTQLGKMDLPPAEQTKVVSELQHPRTLREIASRVDDNETAIEVYLISLMTIDRSCTQGASYLNAMGFILELPPALVQQLHQQVETDDIAG